MSIFVLLIKRLLCGWFLLSAPPSLRLDMLCHISCMLISMQSRCRIEEIMEENEGSEKNNRRNHRVKIN
jgi:hypothetical protein